MTTIKEQIKHYVTATTLGATQTEACRAMYYILEQKFKPGTELAQRLLSTGGHELVEGNWWGDVYWGR